MITDFSGKIIDNDLVSLRKAVREAIEELRYRSDASGEVASRLAIALGEDMVPPGINDRYTWKQLMQIQQDYDKLKENVVKWAGKWLRFAQYWTTGSGMYRGDKEKVAIEAFDWADNLAQEMEKAVE